MRPVLSDSSFILLLAGPIEGDLRTSPLFWNPRSITVED